MPRKRVDELGNNRAPSRGLGPRQPQAAGRTEMSHVPGHGKPIAWMRFHKLKQNVGAR